MASGTTLTLQSQDGSNTLGGCSTFFFLVSSPDKSKSEVFKNDFQFRFLNNDFCDGTEKKVRNDKPRSGSGHFPKNQYVYLTPGHLVYLERTRVNQSLSQNVTLLFFKINNFEFIVMLTICSPLSLTS